MADEKRANNSSLFMLMSAVFLSFWRDGPVLLEGLPWSIFLSQTDGSNKCLLSLWLSFYPLRKHCTLYGTRLYSCQLVLQHQTHLGSCRQRWGCSARKEQCLARKAVAMSLQTHNVPVPNFCPCLLQYYLQSSPSVSNPRTPCPSKLS